MTDQWTDIIPSPLQPVVYAYKYRRQIQNFWIKLQIKAGIGRPSVVITGRAGVGKSVLTSYYHGEANNLHWSYPPQSTDVEIKPIQIGDWTKIFHIIPGQDIKERRVGLDQAFNKADGVEGVIHVVDWGYTSVRDTTVRGQMVDQGINTIEKFREQSLKKELEDFKSILDILALSISNNRGPKWLVIAVHKIDLYENNLHEAQKYYHPDLDNEFAKEISKLVSKVGQDNIKIGCFPICCCPESFEWGKEKVASQIDSAMKYKSYIKSFIEKVAMIQQSAQK